MSDTMLSFGEPSAPFPHRLAFGNRRKVTTDGKVLRCQRYFRWFFPRNQELPEGTSWLQAHDWVEYVMMHSLSWARAGIWMPEAPSAESADFVFRYVEPPLRCGSELNAIGCSTGGLVRLINTHIGIPLLNEWYARGVLHEAAHEAFSAKHDGDGVMGGPPTVRWPSDNDIFAVRQRFVGL